MACYSARAEWDAERGYYEVNTEHRTGEKKGRDYRWRSKDGIVWYDADDPAERSLDSEEFEKTAIECFGGPNPSAVCGRCGCLLNDEVGAVDNDDYGAICEDCAICLENIG